MELFTPFVTETSWSGKSNELSRHFSQLWIQETKTNIFLRKILLIPPRTFQNDPLVEMEQTGHISHEGWRHAEQLPGHVEQPPTLPSSGRMKTMVVAGGEVDYHLGK